MRKDRVRGEAEAGPIMQSAVSKSNCVAITRSYSMRRNEKTPADEDMKEVKSSKAEHVRMLTSRVESDE
jgi:hypothetical protein